MPDPKKKIVPATRQDSLDVYNNTKAINDYYRKQGYIKEKIKDSKDYKKSEKHLKSFINETQKWVNEARNQPLIPGLVTQTSKNTTIKEANKYLKEAQERFSKKKDEVNPKKYIQELNKSKKNFQERKKDIGSYIDEQNNLVEGKPSIEKFYIPIDENKFYQREQSQGFLDLRSPMPLYDKRINPQDLSQYRSPNLVKQDELKALWEKTTNKKEKESIRKQIDSFINTDNVEMYEYDPLAVMPFDMIPLEQQEERIKKYGYSGVPTSVMQQHPEWVNTNTKPIANPTKLNVEGLQPMSVGIQNPNLTINTNLDIPIPAQRQPKYYDVRDVNHQNFGGTDTQYRVDNLKDLRELPKEQWTRTTTPHYSLGGNINNMNRYAEGGTLNQFNEGGTHEQNPLGGIPQGPNATVEQGETSTKTPNGKYIYSNRLYINEDLVKQFNLPNSIKGKTFADASKIIDKPFKDRNSNPDKLTHKEHLDRLKQAQETLKAEEQQRAEQIAQSMQSNQQEVPDMMNGQIPEGMEEYTEQPDQNQMFLGGDFISSEIGNQTGGMSGLSGKMSPYLNLSSNKIKKFEDGGEIDSDELSTQDYLGAATGLASLGALSQGVGASSSKFGSAFSGAATGAQAGMAFGPWGAGIGAAVGLGAGLLGANKVQKQQATNLRNNANAANLTDNFAYGGSIKKFDGGGPLNEGTISDEDITNNLAYQFQRRNNNGIINAQNILGVKPDGDFGKNSKLALREYQKNNNLSVDGKLGHDTYKAMGLNNRGVLPLETLKPVGTNVQKSLTNINTSLPNIPTSSTSPVIENKDNNSENKDNNSDKEDKAGSLFSRNAGKFLKYAPVAMNALQLAKLKKPAYTRLDRLTNRFKPEYVDEQSLQNIANNEMNNSVNAISQIGGSQGAVRNAILGAGLNKSKALSNAYMDASAQNRQTNMAGQQFNLGIDQANINQANQELDINDRNQANYRNEKSKYLGAIGTDLGSIGKEEVNKNQLAEALGYTWDGQYYTDKKSGEKLTHQQVLNKQNSKKYNFSGSNDNFKPISYSPNTNFNKIGR